MTHDDSEASVASDAGQLPPRMPAAAGQTSPPTLLTKNRDAGTSDANQQRPASRSHDPLRWFGRRAIAQLFQKRQQPPQARQPDLAQIALQKRTRHACRRQPTQTAITLAGYEQSQQEEEAATGDCSRRHASKGRQVALRVAQRAASLARQLASRRNASARSLPGINTPRSAASSTFHSGIASPRRTHSCGTYPTAASIGQTLFIDQHGAQSSGTHSHPSSSAKPSMYSTDTVAAANTYRGHLGKTTSRLVQAFPDVAAEAHTLQDFVCSLDHAGIRWYGRIYISSTHFYFTGTGILLSSAGPPTSGGGSSSQQTAVPAWLSKQCSSCVSLASAPCVECALSEQHTQPQPLHGSCSHPLKPHVDCMGGSCKRQSLGYCSLPSAPASARLTFSMDEIPQLAGPIASRSSGRSSTGGSASGSTKAKPWRRTAIKIALADISRVTKELTLGIWPNAMTVSTLHRQYIFTNFLRRDKAYQCLYDAWTSTPGGTLQGQQQQQQQRWQRVKQRLPIPNQHALQTQRSHGAQAAHQAENARDNSSVRQQNPQAEPSKWTATKSNGAFRSYKEPHAAPFTAAESIAPVWTQANKKTQSGEQPTPTASRLSDQPTQPSLMSLQRYSVRQQCSSSSTTSSSHIHINNHSNNNNNSSVAWQRLDPVMLVGQFIGIASQSTLFILLSLVVFCILSSITFL
ncbi:hypothetical protein EV177_005626 [Coemansia sp. RSA 1804]|nr:hypothetical protein EV177_005626 [Coemansia sp. RSA 1804]